jgi:NADH-quinone oxidoreductase subunit L
MWRLVFMTFFGKPRMDHHTWEHCKEQPKRTVVPVAILAVAALTIGFLNVPHFLGGHSNFTGFLNTVVHDIEGTPAENYHSILIATNQAQASADSDIQPTVDTAEQEDQVDHTALEWGLMIASVIWTFFTAFLAYILYMKRPDVRTRIMTTLSMQKLFTVLNNKYYVDELYEAIVIQPIRKLFEFLAAFDAMIVDGLVNLAGFIGRALSNFIGVFDSEIVDGAVNGAGWTAQTGGKGVSSLQSGKIQTVIGSSLILFLTIVAAVVFFLA